MSIMSGANIEIINNVSSTDVDKPLSANIGKELNDSLVFMNQYNRRIRLEEAINIRIANDKRDPTFTKNANRLGYIRERLVESCKIFESYVH